MNSNKKYALIGIFALVIMLVPSVFANQANMLDKNLITSDSNFIRGNEVIGIQNNVNNNPENRDRLFENYNISQWKSFFDTEFGSVMYALKIPGMSLSVVNSTDILYTRGYGYADVDDNKLVDPNSTIFRIGSVSKVFTWTAVMQVYEQGLIDLDEDVNTYLSAFKIKKKFGQPITMRHLMTHSAGFEADWMWNGDATEDTLLSLEDYVIKFQPKRVTPPGETCSYSNYGASLAGYIVTQVSGQDYDTYMEENIFNPLQMNSSTFRQPFPEHLEDNFTSVYSFDADGLPVLSFSELVLAPPAGGAATTASDMAKFMMAHLNNGSVNSVQILEETTTQQMHQRLFANDPRLSGWAYGFVDTTFRGIRILHHGGAVARSGGIIFLMPELDLGVYLSYNCEHVLSTVNILANFLNTFFTLEPFSVLYPNASSIEGLKRFEGKYFQAGVWETTPYKSQRIIEHLEVTISGDGFLLFKGQKYVEVDDLLFRAHDNDLLIAFRENENGKITYLMQGGFTQVPYPRASGIANPTNAWVHMMFCIVLLFLIGIEFPIRKIIEKLSKKESVQKINKTFVSKYTYRLSVGTSSAYVIHIALMFIALFIDFGSNKQDAMALNIVVFLPILIIPFSGLLLISTIYSWIQNEGTLWNRILASTNLVVTGFHLWFIFFWNFVGFLFNYGVWVPYLG